MPAVQAIPEGRGQLSASNGGATMTKTAKAVLILSKPIAAAICLFGILAGLLEMAYHRWGVERFGGVLPSNRRKVRRSGQGA